MHTQQNHRNFIEAIGIALACSFALAGTAMGADKAGIKIALIDTDGKCVKESVTGKLELDRKYVKGDRIVVTGAKNLAVKVDEHFAETLLFAPKGKVDFPIPLWPVGKYAKKYPHPPKAFQGEKHVIAARVPTAREIAAYRNLAVNPMDPRGKSPAYPHASSNSEWGEAAVFSAKTAIDGFVEATGDHHSWPRQSWGPYLPGGKHPEPELTIDFGRPVEIDKLVIVGRYNVRQGGYWKEATVEFSDGSKVTIKPEYNGKRQEFPTKKRVVTSMKFTKLVPNIPKKYAAFVEVEAWGKPAAKPAKLPEKEAAGSSKTAK
ncbi:MAG: discoidin domain-containing protein [Planctomycetes bacterium]|nr:discoidin domain-containing protein [Planctomycetota bacterium]